MNLLPSSAGYMNVVPPYVQVDQSSHLGLLDPEDRSTALLSNMGKSLPIDTV
jgi:hypothetical protein